MQAESLIYHQPKGNALGYKTDPGKTRPERAIYYFRSRENPRYSQFHTLLGTECIPP